MNITVIDKIIQIKKNKKLPKIIYNINKKLNIKIKVKMKIKFNDFLVDKK